MIFRAAVTRSVDFRRSRYDDPVWKTSLLLALAELDRRDSITIAQANLLRGCAHLVAGAGRIEDSNLVQAIDESINGSVGHILRAVLPSESVPDAQTRQKREVQEARSAWENFFGKLDDPRTQRKIQQTSLRLWENAKLAADEHARKFNRTRRAS